MCNCISVVEKHMKERISKDFDDIQSCRIPVTFLDSRKVTLNGIVRYKLMQKNGKIVDKKRTIIIECIFCPFCGEKYPEKNNPKII